MASSSSTEGIPAIKKINKKFDDLKQVPENEWQKVLTENEFNVTRKSGTESAFTGKYDKHFKPGKYTCFCCGADLFLSNAKFNSGCGWPAFSQSIENDKNILRLHDTSFGMERTEVRCRECDAHLGHVFDDGPRESTGERYCINSVSINFVSKINEKEK